MVRTENPKNAPKSRLAKKKSPKYHFILIVGVFNLTF
jgi:hypothetical protein